jgi:hypothetical protein
VRTLDVVRVELPVFQRLAGIEKVQRVFEGNVGTQ